LADAMRIALDKATETFVRAAAHVASLVLANLGKTRVGSDRPSNSGLMSSMFVIKIVPGWRTYQAAHMSFM
jgi:hypothetical protein